jgi:hypothetical protein
MKNSLSLLEKAVLEKILSGDLPEMIKLRRQIEQCVVVKRELTGFGFYTTFSVSEDIPRSPGFDTKIGDVVGEIEGLRNGAGFLLYIADGIIDMLEGYSYDEHWPLSFKNFQLKYTKGEERDWAALKKSLRMKT